MHTTLPAGWMPIESAPKDGTPVLLFARLAGHNVATNDKYAPTIQIGAYRSDLNIWTGSAYRDQREIEIEPISWMTLPPFPGTPPASAQPERDWELTCDECNGSGHVFVERQVAERKTDVQEFKEECAKCEGRGFTIAFEDIPGIAEYMRKSRPVASAQDDAKDATRWRMLPAFLEKYQIEYVSLLRDIDAEIQTTRDR